MNDINILIYNINITNNYKTLKQTHVVCKQRARCYETRFTLIEYELFHLAHNYKYFDMSIIINIYAAEWFVVQTEPVGLVLSVVPVSVWVSRPWNQTEVVWFGSGFAGSDSVN